MFNKSSNPFAKQPAPGTPDPQAAAPRPGSLSTPPTPLTGGSAPAASGNRPQMLQPAPVTKPAGEIEAKAPANDGAPESGNRLIVGPDVKLKSAEILDCDTLVVEGRVEATMDSRVIRIAENGLYSGKVGIDIAEIWGHFEGELTARSQLIIHATGKVSGKIRYGKMLIEEGGQISGEVKSIAEDDSAARPRSEILASVKTAAVG